MRRFSVAGLIGSVVVLLAVVIAPAATASGDRQDMATIRNVHHDQCLTYTPGETVRLGPCGESPYSVWEADIGRVSEIRSIVTRECLEDVDTSNPWGAVAMRPCTGSPRQLWGITSGEGLIQNLGSARYLKANDNRTVYTGALQEYFPYWHVTG
jgi:hypothetical protein